MAIINSDPWEETNSSRDLTQATETKHRDRRLFRFQDLASDYYQVSEAFDLEIASAVLFDKHLLVEILLYY